jgi:hypothetical protein
MEIQEASMTSFDRAPVGDARDAELLRATERERLRALVSGDVERAGELHTEDFQLINSKSWCRAVTFPASRTGILTSMNAAGRSGE